MKTKCATLLAGFFCLFVISSFSQNEPFTPKRVVTTGLSFPWEITYGPDNFIWVTERTGKRVTRVNPTTGAKITAITIAEVYQSAGQDGLLGMVLHPQLLQGAGNDYVYVAYTYDADASGGVDRRAKIRRYTYTQATQTLGSPMDLITDMPASNDHNSGRLAMGPDLTLYYTIGDQGNNQFDNKCNVVRSQDLPTAGEVSSEDWTKYQGKILRMNLDGSIPSTNPTLAGVRSHIFSYGHRNAQGIVFAPDGKLYSDEHGPKSDDEINLIESGGNYGWPRVAGFNDNSAYTYCNWSTSGTCGSINFSDYTCNGTVTQNLTEGSFSSGAFRPPIKTMFTVVNGYNFQNPACAVPTENYFICWPTIGPSSIDIYTTDLGGIPGWANSLLIVSLKRGVVFRMRLNATGTGFINLPNGTDTVSYWETTNRYRDIAKNTDNRTFYIATDNSGSTSGPTSGWTGTLDNPGAILEYQYTGMLLDIHDDPRGGPPRVTRNSIRTFPNPVDDIVNIEMKTDIRKPFTAQILDINGNLRKQMLSMKNEFQMDIGDLMPGIYILRITNGYDFEVHISKIIKK